MAPGSEAPELNIFHVLAGALLALPFHPSPGYSDIPDTSQAPAKLAKFPNRRVRAEGRKASEDCKVWSRHFPL